MDECYEGIEIPTPITPPCGGEYISTECVATPVAIPTLDIAAGDTQALINTALTNAVVLKESQIVDINDVIEPYRERKIYRGSFLDNTLVSVEDTINDVAINKISTGVYTITSSAIEATTLVSISPNGGGAYSNITVSFDYTNPGVIGFVVRDGGVLIDLLESPIKIEA